jgi:hypothetical protein
VALRDATAIGGTYAAGEVTLAVDPFDMSFWPFRQAAHLFPNYQSWTETTVVLTIVWVTLLVSSMWFVAWREHGDGLHALGHRLAPARGFGLRRT